MLTGVEDELTSVGSSPPPPPPPSPPPPPPSPPLPCNTVTSTCTFSLFVSVRTIPHWPLPAVRDLTYDGRLSTCDESVLKLSKVSFRGKCTCTEHPLKLPSPTKLAIFLQLARRATLPARCSVLYLFSGQDYIFKKHRSRGLALLRPNSWTKSRQKY
jgi:hypothetical protein